MVLVVYEGTRTFGLCCFYFLCNMVTLNSVGADEKKELVFVSDGRVFERHYQFEDFFWTGSEDGIEKESSIRNESDVEISLIEASPLETWKTTTVFHTTTILFATVYPNTNSCKDTNHGCTPKISPVQTRSIELSLPSKIILEESEILPCPTQKVLLTDTFDFPNIFSNETDLDIFGKTSTGTSKVSATTSKPNKTENGNVFSKSDSNDENLTGTTVFPTTPLDQKYWIITVLRNDNFSKNLELNLTENKLSTLFKKALNRRQEKYFGGNAFQDRKERKLSQPVKANILNMTRIGRNVEIIYYVSVAGEPVPAVTAANDMRLVTASEVIAELGYPILSKAEPYIKNVVPLGARVTGRTRDTWLLIGSIIAAVLLLMILATLIALILSKKQIKGKDVQKIRHALEEEKGNRNLGFEGDDESNTRRLEKSARRGQHKINESFQAPNEAVGTSVKFTTEDRRESATSSSCSGSSEASLVRFRHQKRRKENIMREKEDKPKVKPRTRLRKIENSNICKSYQRRTLERAGSAISQNTLNEITVEGQDDIHYPPCLLRSPTSYLSMPSVKAFPRGAQIPEPLNKVLEPISIRHFDADSDSPNEYPQHYTYKADVEHVCEVKHKSGKRKMLTRHASLEGDDPGFIGPVVWNSHIQKIDDKGTAVLDGINLEEVDENVNIGKMRKRFNELLDDALSMFGSRNPSPEGNEEESVKQPDNRVHSAVVRPAGPLSGNITSSRPKTTGSRRPQSAIISGPRGAWETPSCSTLVRSDAALVFQKLSPTIEKDLITVNCELGPCDPAVPLIAAIKKELKKFEEPSSNE